MSGGAHNSVRPSPVQDPRPPSIRFPFGLSHLGMLGVVASFIYVRSSLVRLVPLELLHRKSAPLAVGFRGSSAVHPVSLGRVVCDPGVIRMVVERITTGKSACRR